MSGLSDGPFHGFVDIDEPIRIFDIGAAEFDETNRRFSEIAAARKARIVGFEANRNEYDRLVKKYRDQEMYSFLPYVIADGKRHELKVCRLPGCSSLLEPNIKVAHQFQSFAEWMEVLAREPVETVRLDSLHDCGVVDLMKLDIQGGELMALQNAVEKLARCLVIECEVEFICQYVDQPLFSNIESFLRGEGFVFHSFMGYGSRYIKPIANKDNLLSAGSQWLWSDAIFVRNTATWAELTSIELKKMSIILADIYGIVDFAIAALDVVDAREGTALAAMAIEKFPGMYVTR